MSTNPLIVTSSDLMNFDVDCKIDFGVASQFRKTPNVNQNHPQQQRPDLHSTIIDLYSCRRNAFLACKTVLYFM